MTGRNEYSLKAVREAAERIRAVLPEGSVAENEPMSQHTSFRTGGPACELVTCCSEEELAEVLKICAGTDGAAHMLIGNGSNLLVSDEGYPGIVIKLGGSFSDVSIDEDADSGSTEDHVIVRAGAARLLSSVSTFVTEHGLSGMEFASGIPGSMGGAVFMNAGAYGGEMKDIVSSVRLMKQDGGEITELPAEEMDFGYRHSMVEDSGLIVLSAALKLTPDDPEVEMSVDDVTGEMSAVTSRLSEIAEVFRGIANTLASMGGLTVPQIAAGTVVPYKARVDGGTVAEEDSGAAVDSLARILTELQTLARTVTQNNGNSQTTVVPVNFNGKTLFEIVVDENNSAIMRYGSSPLKR